MKFQRRAGGPLGPFPFRRDSIFAETNTKNLIGILRVIAALFFATFPIQSPVTLGQVLGHLGVVHGVVGDESALRRHTSWRFLSLLSVPPDLAQCITIATNKSDYVVKRILSSQHIHALRPDTFSMSKFDTRCLISDLIAAVIQLEG